MRDNGMVPLNMRLPSAARVGEIQSGYSRDIASQSPNKPDLNNPNPNFNNEQRANVTAYFTIQMNNESLPVELILASSSKYRKSLLQRLGLPFNCYSPDIDETPLQAELPADLTARLAMQKSGVICARFPSAVVIGSDQLAVFCGQLIGKPGTHEKAFRQLQSFSGQTVEFLTAVAVRCQDSGYSEHCIDSTRVKFRKLEDTEIERYLKKEKPFDCAGAFKAESLGITLFESIDSKDPTALTGLPLIKTAAMLRRAGLQLP